jgi:hypothetical protein
MSGNVTFHSLNLSFSILQAKVPTSQHVPTSKNLNKEATVEKCFPALSAESS